MPTKIVIKKNTYFDSVSLMSVSTKANKLPGVEQAFVAMATEMNKGVLKNLGLLTPELADAKNGDLMIVIKGDAANEETLAAIEALFTRKERTGSHEARYATIASAKTHRPESNLAVISVNGTFAAREARQALENDLNVMLFSDNVSLDDELALKQLAHEKGLLMMGPDCGTAIINGAGLCFANAVRRGQIGIVGASGTGSQELSVRIHEFGGGVSQLIGTGGRDLSEKIGGLMMLDAIHMLEEDDATRVIALISKPPAPAVAEKVLARARACRKPVVVCFLGRNEPPADEDGLQFARGTKEAALKAVLLTGIKKDDLDLHPLNWPLIEEVRARLTPQQKYIRGLFCGGTSGYSNWELSSGRANAARRVLVKAGLDDERFLRVIGTGSRMPLENSDPSSPANRRISILVLSKTKEQDIRLEDTRMHRPENVLNNTTQQEVRGYSDGHE